MSVTLTTALEQLDKAIAAVDQAFTKRLAMLEQQYVAERGKNQTATQELSATITQLETYLGRTSGSADLQRTGT